MSDAYALSTFGQSGRVAQVDYALQCIANTGKLTVAVKAKNGVVITSECKPSSSLINSDDLELIVELNECVMVGFSGLFIDFQHIVNNLKAKATAYELQYGETAPIRIVADWASKILQKATHQPGVRVFGVAMIVGGVDHTGPSLYTIEPCGSTYRIKGTSLGSRSSSARLHLEKTITETLDIEDAVHVSLSALRESLDGELTDSNVKIAVCKTSHPVSLMTTEEVSAYVNIVNE